MGFTHLPPHLPMWKAVTIEALSHPHQYTPAPLLPLTLLKGENQLVADFFTGSLTNLIFYCFPCSPSLILNLPSLQTHCTATPILLQLQKLQWKERWWVLLFLVSFTPIYHMFHNEILNSIVSPRWIWSLCVSPQMHNMLLPFPGPKGKTKGDDYKSVLFLVFILPASISPYYFFN